MSSTTSDADQSSAESASTIKIDAEVSSWRFRCPVGHAAWVPAGSELFCRTCAEAAGRGARVDPEFDELLDLKTDQMVPWGHVELVE